MNRKQLVAITALPLLTGTMTIVYRWLARSLGERRAWYAGFLVYWPVWCIFLPLRLLGRRRVWRLLRGDRPDRVSWAFVALPPALSLLQRGFGEAAQRSRRERAALLLTALMNGILEELLWRGLYLELFRQRPWWQAGWPTLWFALWHYAPGSVSPLTDTRMLMSGAGFLGAAYSRVARQTDGIRWTAVSHTLAGLIQALV